MGTTPLIFSKGMNLRNSPLALQDGELVACQGLEITSMGKITCRKPMNKVNATALGSIHSFHRYINDVLEADGTVLRYKTYTDPNFTTLTNLSNSNRLRIADSDTFSFIVNGADKLAYTDHAIYTWGVANPTTQPSGSAGAAGNPSGTYDLYYTFYLTFPNGLSYETGPSPVSTGVTVTAQQISWTGIAACPYTGTGLTITRRLYRYSTGLAGIYYVHEVADNSTTTYTDNFSDATLQLNLVLATGTYTPPPTAPFVDVCEYLSRIWGIEGSNLWYSEPFLPFTFTGLNSIQVSITGENLIALVPWGDQLYVGTAATWFRLQGSTTATWTIKESFTDVGIINRSTLAQTKYGLLGLWYDGLYMFDGAVSRNLTLKKIGTDLFTTLVSPASCYAEWNGLRYNFMYSSTGTTIDKVLVMDFTDYPDIKFYNNDFIMSAFFFHETSGTDYIGKSDGFEYAEGGSEIIATTLQTKDYFGTSVYKQKTLEYLYYDLFSDGKDVTVTFYVDEVAQGTKILNTSSRKRSRTEVGMYQGYRFSLKIDCADSQNLIIYEPWAISFTEFGE